MRAPWLFTLKVFGLILPGRWCSVPPVRPGHGSRLVAKPPTTILQLIVGDHYAGEWPRERFAKHGVTYETSRLTKSELYLGLLPLLNSGRVVLLDDRRLRAQLLGLERHTGRGGRDSITHAPGQHDDLINAAAGALLLAAEVATTDAHSFEISEEERQQLRAMGFDHFVWDEDL